MSRTASKKYLLTEHPRLFCPKCKTHLRITNLQKKYWCTECYEYVPEVVFYEGMIKGIE